MTAQPLDTTQAGPFGPMGSAIAWRAPRPRNARQAHTPRIRPAARAALAQAHRQATAGARLLTVVAAYLWRVCAPWVVPTASYACFTLAAWTLAHWGGFAVAGVCLTVAHQQAQRA